MIEEELVVELLIIHHLKFFKANSMIIQLIYGAWVFLLMNYWLEKHHFII